MYSITNYTYKKAKRLGVTVKPSKNKSKKLNVYKNGQKIVSVGAYGMGNYPTYIEERGSRYAKTRRRLYKMRHESDRHKKGTKGWYANQLLW